MSGKNRIADNLNTALNQIGEAKDVSYQYLSTQMKDYIAEAKSAGLTFTLRIRDDTQLSKPLQEAMDELVKSGVGVIERIKK